MKIYVMYFDAYSVPPNIFTVHYTTSNKAIENIGHLA